MENYKGWIGKKVKVVMDRPLGSAHPEFPESIIMVNYGYLPGTHSHADNEEIDAYVLGPDKPLIEFEGMVMAVVVRANDGEIKLVVTDGTKYSPAEIEKQIYFQEKYHRHKLVI